MRRWRYRRQLLRIKAHRPASTSHRPVSRSHRPTSEHGFCTRVGYMRIAQVAPLAESVPPRLYGGTERVVSFLTEELVRLGHDVTLFASGDSQTSARLVSTTPRAIRLDTDIRDSFAPQILMLERVIQSADE